GSYADRNTRMNAANAAALTPVDMNPVTTVGAPSYASGVHMWNGTAEILNANPTSSRPSANSIIGVTFSPSFPIQAPMSPSCVEPVRTYVSATPYRKNALENAPSRKYLKAASLAAGESRRSPVST